MTWKNLKSELRKEADAIFRSTGENIIVVPEDEDETKLVIVSRTQL